MSDDTKFTYSKAQMVEYAQAWAKYNYDCTGMDKRHEVLGVLIHFICDHYECEARAAIEKQAKEDAHE